MYAITGVTAHIDHYRPSRNECLCGYGARYLARLSTHELCFFCIEHIGTTHYMLDDGEDDDDDDE